MRYVLLIYVSEEVTANMSPEERTELVQGYTAFHGEGYQRGMMTGGAPLQPVSSATTVRIRDGKTMRPFWLAIFVRTSSTCIGLMLLSHLIMLRDNCLNSSLFNLLLYKIFLTSNFIIIFMTIFIATIINVQG